MLYSPAVNPTHALISVAALLVAFVAPRVASADPDGIDHECIAGAAAPRGSFLQLSDLTLGPPTASVNSSGMGDVDWDKSGGVTFSIPILERMAASPPEESVEAQAKPYASAVSVWLDSLAFANAAVVVRVDGVAVAHETTVVGCSVQLFSHVPDSGLHGVELELVSNGETRPLMLVIVGELVRGDRECLTLANTWSLPERVPPEIFPGVAGLCMKCSYWGPAPQRVAFQRGNDLDRPDDSSGWLVHRGWLVNVKVYGGPSWWMFLPAAALVLLLALVAPPHRYDPPVRAVVISIWRNATIKAPLREAQDYRSPSAVDRSVLQCESVVRVEGGAITRVSDQIRARVTQSGVELQLPDPAYVVTQQGGGAVGRTALVPLGTWIHLRDEWVWVGESEQPTPSTPPEITVREPFVLNEPRVWTRADALGVFISLAIAYAAPLFWTDGDVAYVMVSTTVALCSWLLLYQLLSPLTEPARFAIAKR